VASEPGQRDPVELTAHGAPCFGGACFRKPSQRQEGSAEDDAPGCGLERRAPPLAENPR
jgi:hypothetical protein